jgi:hypothetical protein
VQHHRAVGRADLDRPAGAVLDAHRARPLRQLQREVDRARALDADQRLQRVREREERDAAPERRAAFVLVHQRVTVGAGGARDFEAIQAHAQLVRARAQAHRGAQRLGQADQQRAARDPERGAVGRPRRRGRGPIEQRRDRAPLRPPPRER